MTPHRRLCMLATGLALAEAACAGQNSAWKQDTSPDLSAIRVTVTNQYGFPMTVYAVGSGTTFRLGKVLPEMVGNFIVPKALVGNGPVEIVAQGDGAPPAQSGPLLLHGGQVVEFTINRPTYTSTARIRP